MKFTPASIELICIGFTSYSTFMIWLNCNQELGELYGLADPSKIQSFYAILVSSVLINKDLKAARILIIYPAISAAMLIAIYFIRIPYICLVGGATNGPTNVVLLNIAVTVVGVLLAVYVNIKNDQMEKARKAA